MADVRALLRQQRTHRRVEHPHALYSETGKLSCTLCREVVRPETAWDDHLRSALHRQNTRAARHSPGPSAPPAAAGGHEAAAAQSSTEPHPQKRKLGGRDAEETATSYDAEDEPFRNKRSRSDWPQPSAEARNSSEAGPKKSDGGGGSGSGGGGSGAKAPSLSQTQPRTPPLARRTSGTPVQGVELTIPSRPATPITRRESLVGSTGGGGTESLEVPSAVASTASSFRSSALSQDPDAPAQRAENGSAPLPPPPPPPLPPAAPAAPAVGGDTNAIDEAEWAAFEAEVVNAPPRASAKKPPLDSVIAAAEPVPLNADPDALDERAASVEDTKLEDELEEAKRALEDEFQDMQELEARVRLLKAKRAALRQQQQPQQPPQDAPSPPGLPATVPAGVAGETNTAGADSDTSDDDSGDESGAEDWVAFRTRA